MGGAVLGPPILFSARSIFSLSVTLQVLAERGARHAGLCSAPEGSVNYFFRSSRMRGGNINSPWQSSAVEFRIAHS